jgi:small subunit ribosomal protein S17e
LGKVRPDQVKKAAREILTRYSDRFTTNFEENKRALGPLAHVYSPRMKNRIAGYITRLMVISKHAETEETEEGKEVTISEETQ